jgi:hypothetical protein
MNNLDVDIQKADWLNTDQKEKLIKIYNSSNAKDSYIQALDTLNFYGNANRSKDKTPWDYKDAMIHAMRLLSLNERSKIVPAEYTPELGNLFQAIYYFFDYLDNNEFEKILDVYQLYNYPQDESINEEIDRLIKFNNLN